RVVRGELLGDFRSDKSIGLRPGVRAFRGLRKAHDRIENCRPPQRQAFRAPGHSPAFAAQAPAESWKHLRHGLYQFVSRDDWAIENKAAAAGGAGVNSKQNIKRLASR